MHLTGIFIYIFWIILYEIRNLIEETKQRYSTKDVSNSEKAIQFCFCIKWTLQILKHISSIKTHCSWSMTDLLQSVCPLALCELHPQWWICWKVLGNYSIHLVENVDYLKQEHPLKQDRMDVQLIATHQLSVRNKLYKSQWLLILALAWVCVRWTSQIHWEDRLLLGQLACISKKHSLKGKGLNNWLSENTIFYYVCEIASDQYHDSIIFDY